MSSVAMTLNAVTVVLFGVFIPGTIIHDTTCTVAVYTIGVRVTELRLDTGEDFGGRLVVGHEQSIAYPECFVVRAVPYFS
jgi:hypothetical protein